MPQILAAATFHDSSKTAFYVAAGVLVAWALLISAAGIRGSLFPNSPAQGRMVMVISAVLVVVTAAMGVVTGKTPPSTHPYETAAVTDGVAPAPTPVVNIEKGALVLSADPAGSIAYSATALVAPSSHVAIAFINRSPVGHNVTVADSSGKVLGSTPTFNGGTKTLRLNLPPGTYTFYCSVPGHEAGGMKGTLTVR